MQALPPDEAAVIARHLETCKECRDDVAELRGDMALLALSVDQQPLPTGAEERFRQKIAATASATGATTLVGKPSTTVIPFEAGASRRRVWPVLVPWATAAALTAVCISLGIANRNLNDTLTEESRLLHDFTLRASHAQQIVDVLNAPNAQRVILTATKHAVEPSGKAIYLADRGGLLFQGENLKPLDPGKTYELWVIPADGKAPVAAGVFKPDASGYASVVLPQLAPGIGAKAFAVTIENDPGSSTPTMPIILSGG
jgi:hypothetical protein